MVLQCPFVKGTPPNLGPPRAPPSSCTLAWPQMRNMSATCIYNFRNSSSILPFDGQHANSDTCASGLPGVSNGPVCCPNSCVLVLSSMDLTGRPGIFCCREVLSALLTVLAYFTTRGRMPVLLAEPIYVGCFRDGIRSEGQARVFSFALSSRTQMTSQVRTTLRTRRVASPGLPPLPRVPFRLPPRHSFPQLFSTVPRSSCLTGVPSLSAPA